MIDLEIVKEISGGIAALGSIVGAYQAWRAHSKSNDVHSLLTQMRIEMAAKQTTTINLMNNPAQTIGAAVAVPKQPEDTGR
jgi:hypothetical protein